MRNSTPCLPDELRVGAGGGRPLGWQGRGRVSDLPRPGLGLALSGDASVLRAISCLHGSSFPASHLSCSPVLPSGAPGHLRVPGFVRTLHKFTDPGHPGPGCGDVFQPLGNEGEMEAERQRLLSPVPLNPLDMPEITQHTQLVLVPCSQGAPGSRGGGGSPGETDLSCNSLCPSTEGAGSDHVQSGASCTIPAPKGSFLLTE